MEKAAASEALGGVQAALSAAQADGSAALAEVAALTTQLDAAERSKAALEADLGSHIERHASGVQDSDALSRQLAAAQAEAAAASGTAAELQVEVGPSHYDLEKGTKAVRDANGNFCQHFPSAHLYQRRPEYFCYTAFSLL